MTFAEALEELSDLVDANTWPTLGDSELVRVLNGAAVVDDARNAPANVTTVSAWAATTAYSVGDVVKVDARWFRAVVAGTSGSSTPSWPDLDGEPRTSYRVTDGSVVWEDNGGEWAGKWDLNAAAARAWRLKAGKVAGAHNFTTDGQAFSRGDVHKHCMAMAREYARQQVGSAQIG